MNHLRQKKLILLADDDPDFLFQMKFRLEKAGYAVEAVSSQSDALSFMAITRPDLAIFDLMMEQDDSGFVLAFRAKQLYQDLPVILLTAVTAETGWDFRPDNEDSQNWIKVDQYLEKGLHPNDIIRQVGTLLNG